MTKPTVTITVGASLDEAGASFLDAWKRAERGEDFRERHLAFESWEALERVMTPKRYALLRHVRQHPARSVAALARELGRPYRRVHDDVEALMEAGLITRDDDLLTADYDRIGTQIAIA